jgi:class 3 adenylate cyclase
MEIPRTRYARSADGTFIAFQVFGNGPVDLLWISPWFSDLELLWEYPPVVRFYQQLSAFARVVMLDQRGIGLSDRLRGFPDLETRMDDLRAVLDAVGSERTVLWGAGPDGGGLCSMFAATYPDRVTALAFWNAGAKATPSPDYPWGGSPEATEGFYRLIETGWGDEDRTAEIIAAAGAPSIVGDPDTVRWAARVCRRMGAPGDVLAFDRMWNDIDFRSILPSIQVPAVAIFRATPGDPDVTGQYQDLVARVPGAVAVELPAGDFPPWVGDASVAVGPLREFIQAIHAEQAEFDRVLATVMFTDIVGSTQKAAELGDIAWHELLERHHAYVRVALSRYRGVEVNTAGDGFLATFDGPARAIRCAQLVVRSVAELGLEVRAGLHTGEVESINGQAGGIGVHVGARVGAMAAPSQVLVSSTVKDLTLGSGIDFEDAGEHELKGVPGRWHLYSVLS